MNVWVDVRVYFSSKKRKENRLKFFFSLVCLFVCVMMCVYFNWCVYTWNLCVARYLRIIWMTDIKTNINNEIFEKNKIKTEEKQKKNWEILKRISRVCALIQYPLKKSMVWPINCVAIYSQYTMFEQNITICLCMLWRPSILIFFASNFPFFSLSLHLFLFRVCLANELIDGDFVFGLLQLNTHF